MYTDDSLSPESVRQAIVRVTGFPVAIKHKRVREETRNDGVITLKFRSSFHKIAKHEDALELPFADHFICRPTDRQDLQATLERELRRGGGDALRFRKL